MRPLKIGDSIHTHNLELPEEIKPVIKSYDQTIVTITGRTDEKEESTEGQEPAEGSEVTTESEEGSETDAKNDTKE